VTARRDAEWSYYREFLYPNEERRRWMRNRRAVDALRERSDPLDTPRRVVHFAFFGRAADRQRFAAAVNAMGFTCEESTRAGKELSFAVRIQREDAIGLEAIHPLTDELAALARECGGVYDGWETTVLEHD
jgi:hypothetical protein